MERVHIFFYFYFNFLFKRASESVDQGINLMWPNVSKAKSIVYFNHEIALNFQFHRKVKAGHDFEYNTCVHKKQVHV